MHLRIFYSILVLFWLNLHLVWSCPYLAQKSSVGSLKNLPVNHPPLPLSKNGANNLKSNSFDSPAIIGPDCTQLAHNDYLPPSGRCEADSVPPSFPAIMKDYGDQPLPTHVWSSFYELDWTFYFINDFDTLPPFNDKPDRYVYLTSGHTYYDQTAFNGKGAQRERYDTHCISIFVDGPLVSGNFSCDFVIRNDMGIGYFITHEDRPVGAPECCIIGQPFHSPKVDFFKNLYINKYSEHSLYNKDDDDNKSEYSANSPYSLNFTVDWGGLTLPQAGAFMYGFYRDPYTYSLPSNPGQILTTSQPYAFYFMGMPFANATWQYQMFSNFHPEEQPPIGSFDIPDSCSKAVVCPGWS